MPVTEDIRARARDLNALQWVETLEEWEQSLNDPPTPFNWHLTDLRHLGNLGSAQYQGILTPQTPPRRRHQIELLEDNIRDWLEDHFVDEEEESEEETSSQEATP